MQDSNKILLRPYGVTQHFSRTNVDMTLGFKPNIIKTILTPNIENIVPVNLKNYDPDLFTFFMDDTAGTCYYDQTKKILIVTPKKGIKEVIISVKYYKKILMSQKFFVK